MRDMCCVLCVSRWTSHSSECFEPSLREASGEPRLGPPARLGDGQLHRLQVLDKFHKGACTASPLLEHTYRNPIRTFFLEVNVLLAATLPRALDTDLACSLR